VEQSSAVYKQTWIHAHGHRDVVQCGQGVRRSRVDSVGPPQRDVSSSQSNRNIMLPATRNRDGHLSDVNDTLWATNVREVIYIDGGGSDVTWLGCALKSYIGRSGWFYACTQTRD
jgi:hypothetical protein